MNLNSCSVAAVSSSFNGDQRLTNCYIKRSARRKTMKRLFSSALVAVLAFSLVFPVFAGAASGFVEPRGEATFEEISKVSLFENISEPEMLLEKSDTNDLCADKKSESDVECAGEDLLDNGNANPVDTYTSCIAPCCNNSLVQSLQKKSEGFIGPLPLSTQAICIIPCIYGTGNWAAAMDGHTALFAGQPLNLPTPTAPAGTAFLGWSLSGPSGPQPLVSGNVQTSWINGTCGTFGFGQSPGAAPAIFLFAVFGSDTAPGWSVVTLDPQPNGHVNPRTILVENGTAIGTLPTPTRPGATFLEWNTTRFAGGQTVTPATIINENMTIHARWQVEHVSIEFALHGGTINGNPSNVIVTRQAGQALSLVVMPQDPVRSGHLFLGWFTNANGTGTRVVATPSAIAFSSMVDVTVHAYWIPVGAGDAIVTFDPRSGSTPNNNVENRLVRTVPIGEQIGDFPTVTRTGHTFAGWYTSPNFNEANQINSTHIITASPVTFYARWNPIPWTVTWNAQGGSPAMSTSVHNHNTQLNFAAGTVSGTAFPEVTRAGHHFVGWYTTASAGTGDAVLPNRFVTGNITFHARWVVDIGYRTYTFNPQGGTAPQPSNTVTARGNTALGSVPTTTKTGYIFGGWWTEPVTGGEHILASRIATENRTVYARWSADPNFTPLCDGPHWGGWQTVTPPTCVLPGQERRETTCDCNLYELRPIPALGHNMGQWTVVTPPTCTDYGLERQPCNRSGCNHYITRPIPPLGHDMGQWTVYTPPQPGIEGEERMPCTRSGCNHFEARPIPALPFTVIFVDDETKTSSYVYLNDLATAPSYDGREDYYFGGWFVDGDIPWNPNIPITSNLRIYAIYNRVQLTFTFIDLGIETSFGVLSGMNIEPMQETGKPHWRFAGWATCPDGEALFYFGTPIRENTRVYAQYEPIIFNIIFDTNFYGGGALNTSVKSGQKVSELELLERQGYIFLGWFDENGELFDFDTLAYRDKLLTAHWEAIESDYEINEEEASDESTRAPAIQDNNTTRQGALGPKTGDVANVSFWLTLSLIASAVAAFAALMLKRERRKFSD